VSREAPRGHAAVLERLFAAARAGHLPHALSFEGPAGIGKFKAALWLAQGLLCARGPGEPCGACGPCKRVESENHADLLVIDPLASGDETIRIGSIAHRGEGGGAPAERCVETALDLRAAEGGMRCVILREAQRMNHAAQNALLKTLEEPRPGTVLVLETHRPELLLPTILSRCVRVRFASLPADDTRALLRAAGLDDETAGCYARWSGGSPGTALSWHARNGLAIRALLEDVLLGRREPFAASRALWELDGSFEARTPTAAKRERARTVLDLCLALERDRSAFAAGMRPEELAHGDLVPALPPHPDTGRLEALVVCRADVERNLDPEATLERALLACAR
jgi:DNA polymerase-3 subunit delta'